MPVMCLAQSSPAAADAAQAPRPYVTLGQRFERANSTKDGHLTLDQAKLGMPRIAEHFAEIDTGKKGFVTLDQVRAYANAYHRAHGDTLPAAATTATR